MKEPNAHKCGDCGWAYDAAIALMVVSEHHPIIAGGRGAKQVTKSSINFWADIKSGPNTGKMAFYPRIGVIAKKFTHL